MPVRREQRVDFARLREERARMPSEVENAMDRPVRRAGARSPSPSHGRSPFPPIREYGFLSDCEVTALIAPSGNVEWLCVPRLDSPSVFGAILDRDAGGFRF